MKLIDADKLKSVIVENYRAEFFGSVLWDILNDIPTAYDIDKVVEELENKCISPNDYPGYVVDLEKAIEIVKQQIK